MTSRKSSRDNDKGSRKNSSSDDKDTHSKHYKPKIPPAPSYTHHVLHLTTCADDPEGKCAAGKCDIAPPAPPHHHHTRKLSKSDKSDNSHNSGSYGSGSGNNGGKGKGGGMKKPHDKHHKDKGKKEKEPFRPLPPSPPPLPQKHKGNKGNHKQGSLEKPFDNDFGNLERQIMDEGTQDNRKILQTEQTQYESFPGANKRNAETMKYVSQDGSSQYATGQKSKFGNNTNSSQNPNSGEICIPPQAVHMICTPEFPTLQNDYSSNSNSNPKRNDPEKNSEKVLSSSYQTPQIPKQNSNKSQSNSYQGPDIPEIRNSSASASANSNRYSNPSVPTVMMARSNPPHTTEGTQFQGIEDTGIQYNEPKNTSTQSDAIPLCEPPPKGQDEPIPNDTRNLSKGVFPDGAQNQNQIQNRGQEQHRQAQLPPKKQQHGQPPQHLQGQGNVKKPEQYENDTPSQNTTIFTRKMPLPPLPPPRSTTSQPPHINANPNPNSANGNNSNSSRPLPHTGGRHWTNPKAYYPPYQDSNNRHGKNPSSRASSKQEEEKCIPCTPEQLQQQQQEQAQKQPKEEICFPIDDSNRSQFISRANPVQIPKNRYDYYSDDSVFPPEQSYENQLAQSFSTRPASAPTSTSTPKSSRGKSRAMQRKPTSDNGSKGSSVPTQRQSM